MPYTSGSHAVLAMTNYEKSEKHCQLAKYLKELPQIPCNSTFKRKQSEPDINCNTKCARQIVTNTNSIKRTQILMNKIQKNPHTFRSMRAKVHNNVSQNQKC